MNRFNSLYIELLNFIEKHFPNYKKYTTVDSNKNYLQDFIEYTLPFMEDISTRNVDIFLYKHSNAQLIRGLKFKRVIDHVNNRTVSAKVLESIWRLLHKLYIVAYGSCDLKKIIRKNYGDNSDLQRVIESHNLLVENIMLSGYPIVDDNSGSDSADEEDEREESDEEEQQLRDEFNKMFDKHGRRKKDENGQEKGTGEVENEENNSGEGQGPNLEGMFDENSLIGGLAKELSSEIDPKELGDIKSFADIGKLFAPGENGENKLQNVMKTVTQKLDTKMKNGQLNQEQLLNEAQNMMGNMGQMFGQMGGANSGGNPMDMMSSMMGMMGGMGMQGSNGSRKQKRRVNKHRRR